MTNFVQIVFPVTKTSTSPLPSSASQLTTEALKTLHGSLFFMFVFSLFAQPSFRDLPHPSSFDRGVVCLVPLFVQPLYRWITTINHCIAGYATINHCIAGYATIDHCIAGVPISTIVSLEYHYRPLYRWNTTINHRIAGIPLSTIVSLEYHYQPLYRWNTNINHCIAGTQLLIQCFTIFMRYLRS